MTTPERDLLDVLAQVVGPDHLATVQSWPRTYDPAANLDEDTIRRSRLSMAAARAQRRRSEKPTEPWRDSLATRAERAWGGDVA